MAENRRDGQSTSLKAEDAHATTILASNKELTVWLGPVRM